MRLPGKELCNLLLYGYPTASVLNNHLIMIIEATLQYIKVLDASKRSPIKITSPSYNDLRYHFYFVSIFILIYLPCTFLDCTAFLRSNTNPYDVNTLSSRDKIHFVDCLLLLILTLISDEL